MKTLGTFTERVSEEVKKTIELCKDFNLAQGISQPVNKCLDYVTFVLNKGKDSDELVFTEEYKEGVLFTMTELVFFLTSLHENIEYILKLEQHIENDEEYKINNRVALKIQKKEIEDLKKKLEKYEGI